MSERGHGPPPAGLECLVTFEDITPEDRNFCEYCCAPSRTWKAAKMSCEVVEMMRMQQFGQYMDRIKKSTCAAEMRRLLEAGPPEYVSDKHGLPMPEGDTHIETLWYASDGEERSARLEGAPTGAEREALWQSLREFQGEGDTDEDGEQEGGGEAQS
uniref:Uncharacterized protein n=1 Tax=Phaeomonas parva TaxID=124430 RepID=A0A7S1XY23_9STRA|mmetsp:Transcript_44271/g.139029  ORF Transcript_44271/g.139029 Transcript_44271/m.139029 type:complete len:157 (+) Transcript_44271:83-553(+)